MVATSRARGRVGRLVAALGLALASQSQGVEPDDLLPRLERQQREASQSLRLEQQRSTLRDQDVSNTREQFQQGVLHEQQRRTALVQRWSTNRAGTTRQSTRATTNTRLQQFRRQQRSQLLRFKITR